MRKLINETEFDVVNVDKLGYAGNLDSLVSVSGSPRYRFHHVDILDADAIRAIFAVSAPMAVLHLAAESHVDRSIDGPGEFVQTNVNGTFTMLQEALRYWRGLSPEEASSFRFVHVSTDEVFGSLGETGLFTESTPYHPNSPYSASKAASDHLARAWFRTYGLPVVITNCSNNYGPYQFPEKMVPLMILNARDGRRLPVYGHGNHVRDWLFVDDHVDALLLAMLRGRAGESYNIGGRSERRNIDVVRQICAIMDDLAPDGAASPRTRLIEHVPDRPGHDERYAIDCSKIERDLGWRPATSFEAGLRRTVEWYLANPEWCERVQSGAYRGERLGLGAGV